MRRVGAAAAAKAHNNGIPMYALAGLEVTTTRGCRILCRYCPQEELLRSPLSKSQRLLRLEDFTRICEKLPRPFRLHFTGFSEPFHNPECAAMMRHAHREGYHLKLSTTLSGVGANDLDVFERCICFRTILHLPAAENLMNLPIIDEYVEILGRVLPTLGTGDLVLTFGSRFHDRIASLVAQHEHAFEVKVIAPESSDWNTRAGNKVSFKRTPDLSRHARLRCTKDRLFQNVLLPDGTVVLCCMDWTGKHVLGNLLTQSYEEITSGEEMKHVLRSLENGRSGTLCWTCEYAAPA
jgi:organic radical activating enzyme